MDNIYWIVMLDNIKYMIEVITIIVGVLVIFAGVGGGIFFSCQLDFEWDKFKPYFIKSLKYYVITVIFISILIAAQAFIPNTKQMIAIITIPKIINNEQIQDMPDNALKLINKKLKEWAEETEILEKTK